MTNKIIPIEGKFPQSAIITQSSATLNDMGDMFISMQVKMENLTPSDFAYDWEVEFKGERYIHTLREPQASKGNDSICSIVNLTFQHWTIYQLRRYYFVEMASTNSGTAIADKYISSLSVNLKDFCDAFQLVLDYYFDGAINIERNPEWQYVEEVSFVEINYTHIWDVLQKMYEIFGVRWTIEGTTIKVGYPSTEVSHVFEYGFDGGLLKVERQVQNTDIRNSLLGRGGERNLPYRYFKDVDEKNPTFKADPDWIPELASIYFSELRGKTFRDYIKGWKAHRYGGEPMNEPTEEYNRGYEDSAKAEDGRYFNPIEYVEDKESIAKYGLLQGGLENQEDTYPSIQGVEVDGLGRVDEVVGVEEILVDETLDTESRIKTTNIDTEWVKVATTKDTKSVTRKVRSDVFTIANGCKGTLKTLTPLATCSYTYKSSRYLSNGSVSTYNGSNGGKNLDSRIVNAKVYNASTNEEVIDFSNLAENTSYYYEVEIEAYGGFPQDEDKRVKLPNVAVKTGEVIVVNDKHTTNFKAYWDLEESSTPSVVVGNYSNGVEHIYGEIKRLGKDAEKSIDITSEVFVIPQGGATMIDAPINIIAKNDAGDDISGTYEWEKYVKLVNIETNEVVSSINIPEGSYYMRVNVRVKNNYTNVANYKIELLTAYVYLPIDIMEWSPKFDIWIKNIWGTTRNEGESDVAYVERIWTPILGDRQGDEAKVVFSTGWLSGHSDYEFPIVEIAYAGNDSVAYNGIQAEWRLTLAKSDAELEATGKYIPSTQTQAKVGDYFYFIGVDMPHQYVLWAEEAIDNFKRDQLLETANIKPNWVVQIDKVRLNQMQVGETSPLFDSLNVGNSIFLRDERFIQGVYETLYLQSITYNWGVDVVLHPNVEVVLSTNVATSTNPVAQIQGQVDVLAKQVGSISNVQQIVRTVGDKIYLRKDGITDEISNSPTKFARDLTSKDFRQGNIGGFGWGLRVVNGKSIIEADKLILREDLQVNSFVVNQTTSIGGKQIYSAASITCTRVEVMDDGIVCYFDQKQGSIENLFVVGDIAYSQVFSPENIEVKYYKREVIGISANSITLSLNGDGEGLPQAGDVIIQYGNVNDSNRQYVIIRDVIGGGYERMICDLDSITSLGTEYYFAGRMNGDTPRWFIGNKEGQYIEYKDGHLRIYADIKVGANSDLSAFTEFKEIQDTIADLEYLKEALSKDANLQTMITNAMVLSSMLGVWDSNDDIVSFLNGSDFAQHPTYGKLILASGIPTSGGTLEERANNATIRLYEDGTLIANKGIFKGQVLLGDGKIQLNQDGSGQLADGAIKWNADGLITQTYPNAIQWIALGDVLNDDVLDLSRGGYISDVCSRDFELPNAPIDGFVLTLRGPEVVTRLVEPSIISCAFGTNFVAYIDDGSGIVSSVTAPKIELKAYGRTAGEITLKYSATAQTWTIQTNGVITQVSNIIHINTNEEQEQSVGNVTNLRTTSATGTQSVTDDDETIVVTSSKSLTLTLPSSPVQGRRLEVVGRGATGVTFSSSRNIYRMGNGKGATTQTISAGYFHSILIFDGTYWILSVTENS